MASSAAAAAARDQLRVEQRGGVLELRWSDAEERLQGTVHPALPLEGEPLSLSLHVGSFEGPELDGPLTLTFHKVGSPAQQTLTLPRSGVNWHTELVPDEAGLWELEIRYRATHLKVLSAQFTVASRPLPRSLGWALVALAAGTALVLGVRNAVRRMRPSPPPSDAASGQSSQ